MENKIRNSVVDIKWSIIIIFIAFFAGVLMGIWFVSLPHKNSVNVGSSGDGSSMEINQSNK